MFVCEIDLGLHKNEELSDGKIDEMTLNLKNETTPWKNFVSKRSWFAKDQGCRESPGLGMR